MIIICTENEKKELERIIDEFGKQTSDCEENSCEDCPMHCNCMELDNEKVSFKIVEHKVV